jgi:hypothetical protein
MVDRTTKDDMPGIRSARGCVGKQALGIGVRIMLVLLLVAATVCLRKLYIVQETLAVLLLLAVATLTFLVFAIAFMLIQEGVRQAVLWAKTGDGRLASLSPFLNVAIRKRL